MKADKIALGILGGIAAGAVLGILFAPDKGEETRKKIAKKGSDYAGDLKDKFGNILGTLNNNYEKIFRNDLIKIINIVFLTICKSILLVVWNY